MTNFKAFNIELYGVATFASVFTSHWRNMRYITVCVVTQLNDRFIRIMTWGARKEEPVELMKRLTGVKDCYDDH